MKADKSQLPKIENSDIGILQFCLKVLYEHEYDELAWRLIERFGSVSAIFSASFEELISVDGVTDRVATFFSVMRPLQRQAQLRAVKGVAISTEREQAEYAAVYFMNEYNPCDVCVCLNKKNKIIGVKRLAEEQRVREIAATACRRNAQKVVLMRFEPRINEKRILPTPERQRLLIKIIKILNALDIEFVDYVEYSRFHFFSLRRAVGGDIGVYHVSDANDEQFTPWQNADIAVGKYYETCLAHAIAQKLKPTENK